jgi:hypothetical protein
MYAPPMHPDKKDTNSQGRLEGSVKAAEPQSQERPQRYTFWGMPEIA